jgi:hypothetical protein
MNFKGSVSDHSSIRLEQGKLGRACGYFDVKALARLSVTTAEYPGVLATTANNIGMRSAIGKYIVLMDDD